MKQLGKIHLWWLEKFGKADKAGHGGLCVSGYEGTAQGRALIGLLNRELIKYKCGFDGCLDVLQITDKGREFLK